jgi:hypothetical protein
MELLKKISPALYVVILIGFFLPFIEISCSTNTLGTFSGYTVMTGDAGQSLSQTSKDVKSGINLELIIAFIMAMAGLALSFFKNPKSTIGTAIAGLIGFIFLMIFKSNLDSQIQSANQFMSIVQIHYKIGFWICFLFFLGAVILNIILFFTKKKAPPTAAVTAQVASTASEAPVHDNNSMN